MRDNMDHNNIFYNIFIYNHIKMWGQDQIILAAS